MQYKEFISGMEDTSRGLSSFQRVNNPAVVFNTFLGVLLSILLTIILLYVVKVLLKDTGENFWDWLTRPFKTLFARNEALTNAKATGTAASISLEEAKTIADDIYSCFDKLNDNEERLYAILNNKVKTAADWELIKGQYGTRPTKKLLSYFQNDGDLEYLLSNMLSSREQKKVKSILSAKGITIKTF